MSISSAFESLTIFR